MYEGDWKNNKKDGKGAFYLKNGDQGIGNFKNNKPIGIFALKRKNGKVKALNY